MKKLLLSAFFAGATVMSQAQFINLDFEGTDANNALIGDQPNGWLAITGTKITTGQYQGAKSWKVTTATNATVAGIIGWPSNDIPGVLQQSFEGSVTIPTSVDMYVKYTQVGGDTAALAIVYKDTLAAGSADDVDTDAGYMMLTTSIANWTAVNIPVVNFAAGNPNSALIALYSSSGGNNIQDTPGSELFVDAIVFNFPTGVSETINGEIKPVLVYPNPAQNMVNFHAGGDAAYVEIMDLTGKVVLASALNTGANQFNVSELSNGSYIYTIKNVSNEVLMTEKLIIAH